MEENKKQYAYILPIGIFFVSVLLISNIASTKIVTLGWFTFDGGTLLFPLSYIFGDILTEVYGYKKTKEIIWLGFISALMMSIIFMIVEKLPAAVDWGNQTAYDTIIGTTPRIVLASLIAYTCGSFSNAFVLAKMKIWTKGKYLWTRTIGSTIVGELLDSSIFICVAFIGVFSVKTLGILILSNYVFKTCIEVICTPITYKIIAYLKNKESVDHYDAHTDFNPLHLA